MKARIFVAVSVAYVGIAFAQAPAPATLPSAKPAMPAVCGSCHKPAPGTVQGYFENVAFKSESIQLNLGTAMEIVKFDAKSVRVTDAGVAKPAEHLQKVRKGHEARVAYVERDGVKWATAVAFKGPIKIAPEKLVSYADVAQLVAQGPERGNYTLVDSRPLPRFQEGTIPSAISLPFPAFDKLVDRLPQDKQRLVVFFCQGVTCMMSPSSLLRAEALGYANVKVYREGWPEWTKKSHGVLTAASLREAFIAKDIPHVLVDARRAGEAERTGFIPGAVTLPADEVKAALASFPDKALKAPIVFYDLEGGEEAMRAARVLTASGYENVLVLTGGLEAWKNARFPFDVGAPATKIAYVPKPRQGSLPADEFQRIARERPADILILDVRNREEAKEGMIPGAVLVPDEEVLARLSEIPADKRIVTHCSTGVRAEMAYHKLKERGYKVAFLNADVDIEKSGNFYVTPK